ncbi:uncharacterized protein THITE_2148412 [Thermothielavioides terrestris NRRL 8126]|uniref:C2H2-type domain-containing protein n=1 Tax=Thermothielavioides terrestris (strain ATCC 38088 / NRRL 8126) TaxID=578455 RepID=G2RG73_THETT|nr:uncharacterized protein THITE_2148412 [Thermothielavioides terrestris NRRL 8126]AEO71816.1 hypothetical protein THITE_2148412 [Thermothielavioides terrestris NRRL 8126]
MLPFRPKSVEEKPDSSNTTAPLTARKHATTVAPPSIRNDDPDGLDGERSSQPVVAATEIVPIADYAAPLDAPSEPAPTSCGETFSALTEGTPRSRWTAPRPEILLGFTNFIVYDDATRTLPFEIDGHPEVSGSHASNPCPLPWLYEFSWTDGVLLFAGDRLNKALSKPSELGGATFGDSMERSATASVSTDVMTRKSWDSANLERAVIERQRIQGEIEETRAFLLRRLEAHWRSHPPQRSGRREKGKGPAYQAEQRPTARACGQPYDKKGFAGRRHRIGQGSGDGDGDEDEDDNSDSAPTPPSSAPHAQNRWYACPYQKWRPKHYLFECGTGFRRITDVKTHLLKKHFAITCPRCYTTYDDEDALRLHRRTACSATPPKRRGGGCYMNERQRDTIKAHFGGKKMQHHEQWAFLFRTLFPNEPFPESIYLLPRQAEYRNFLERWVRSTLNDIRYQAFLDGPHLNWSEPRDTQDAAVTARFITLRLQEDFSEERLHADFAMAQQDFETMAQQDFESSSSSAATASAGVNHPPLTHDALLQLPTIKWNPPLEPNLPWLRPTVGEHAGIPGLPNLGPTSACSNNSTLSKVSAPGFGDNATTSLIDCGALAPPNGQPGPSNIDSTGVTGIPGFDLPGPSSAAQWAGACPQAGFLDLDPSHLTNAAAAPEPSASAIAGVDDSAWPLTAWNPIDPIAQGENWSSPDAPFDQGFGSLPILDDGMNISEVFRL